MTKRLVDRLQHALDSACTTASSDSLWPPMMETEPVDRADRLLTLLTIYDLYTSPLELLGPRARSTADPAMIAVKRKLERDWLAELDGAEQVLRVEADPAAAIRSLATKDRLPTVYRWVANTASLEELRHFLAIEGGPDGGFDDLVALCQVGLSGTPKMEMARNYWDEMGNGIPADVHTDLHRGMASALQLPQLSRNSLPEPALARAALNGLLATNRWLQPEMIGALGLTELQAGPRCRLVLKAFQRLGLSTQAAQFYAVHADADPRHGKHWLENVIAPLAVQVPDWGSRMIRGAKWRWIVNTELFEALDPRTSVPAAA